MTRSWIALALSVGLLSGCLPAGFLPQAGGADVGSTVAVGAPILSGHVAWPAPFRTKAIVADVANLATISLIDGTGATLAAGVTNGSGAFTLYQSTTPFVPVDGSFYRLEVSKRLSNHALVSLRTVLKREAGAWTSITGPTIVINPTTTAVALIDAGVPLASMINTVSGASYDVPAAVGAYTPLQITRRVTTMTAELTRNADPGQVVATKHTGNFTIHDAATLAQARGFSEITGDLIISPTVITEAVVELPWIETVGGNIAMENAPVLSSVKMPNLTSLAGALTVRNAPVLNDLDFSRLTTCAAALTFDNCPILGTFGLWNLTSSGDITVNQCPTFTFLPFTKLASAGKITVSNCAALNNFDLGFLTTVAGLSATNCAAMQNFSIGPLTTINGDITLTNNPNFLSFGIGTITTMTGGLTITDCPNFAVPNELANVTTLTSLTLRNVGAGFAATGLDNLNRVTGNVSLSLRAANSTGLANLAQIDGNLAIPDGGTYPNTAHLPGLTAVGGSITMQGSTAQPTSPTMAALATIGGSVDLDGSSFATWPALTSVTGAITQHSAIPNGASGLSMAVLTTLASYHWTVDAGGNANTATAFQAPLLQSVTGDVTMLGGQATAFNLNALQTIGGNFRVNTQLPSATVSLPSLTTTTGWDLSAQSSMGAAGPVISAPALQTVNGNFSIQSNSGTQIIAGYTALNRVNGNFTIQGNTGLAGGTAAALRDQVVNANGIGGAISVQP